MIAKMFGLLLLVGGLLLWLVSALPSLPTSMFATGLYERPVASPFPAAERRATLEGAVIFSERGGRPVPYIEYRHEGSVRTKQLIFNHGRGCQPSAGDLPCAPGFEAPVPDLSYGERIRVRGTILGDQIIVEEHARI